MLDLALTILKGLLPAIASSLLLVGVFGRRCIGLAMAVGVLTAYTLLREFPPLPDALFFGNNDAMQWLLWCSLAAGLLGLAGGIKHLPQWLLVAGGLLLLGAEVWLLLQNRTRDLAPAAAVLTQAVAFVAIAAVWLLLRQAADRRPDVGPVVLWTGCLGVDAALLLFGRSALQGQLAGAAAAALGTAALTALWRRPFAIDRSSALAFAALHGGLLLTGNQLADLPLLPALLALAAPASLALLPRRQPGEGNAAFVAVTLVAATLLGTALGLVARAPS